MAIPSNRRGCRNFTAELLASQAVDKAKLDFERNLSELHKFKEPIAIWNSKLSHSGIVNYKTFENVNRRLHSSSLANLLNSQVFDNYVLHTLVNDFKQCSNDDSRSRINDQACELLDQNEFDQFLKHTHQARCLNSNQSRKIASYAKKLAYYTQARQFKSKKSGKYQMRTAFITLTAPDSANPKSVNEAFNHFLDYLQRTANCVYVWKKELGEKSGNLHFHIIVNNFIPYYIIAWKWKRLLLAQGVAWTLNADGAESNSHYRIELPRNRKQTAHYISKYMSKAYALPGEFGYISGHSSVLDELKEFVLIEGDCPKDELAYLNDHYKVIRKDHVSIVCVDLLTISQKCPYLGALFEEQYMAFSERITLPQKFHEV